MIECVGAFERVFPRSRHRLYSNFSSAVTLVLHHIKVLSPHPRPDMVLPPDEEHGGIGMSREEG